MKTQWLIFDIGKVVALGDENLCYKALVNYGVLPVNVEKIFSCSEYYDFLRGKISQYEFYNVLINQYLRSPLSYDEVSSAFKQAIHAVDDQIVWILSQLDRNKLAFLTDTNVWQEERLSELINLRQFSDKIFKSHEIHMVKTDENCFPYVINQLRVNPNDALLIDDSSEKIQMATQCGLQTLQFINSEKLSHYLKNSGWLL